MQRRAAAIYFVFFLVVAAGAWAYVGYAEDAYEPQFSLDGTSFENGTTAAIDGVEYTVNEIGYAGGGGHGGGGGSLEAVLTYTDPEASQSATLEHNATVTYDDAEYTVLIPNESDVSSFALEESFNVSALLAENESVQNALAEQNGTQYVVTRENTTLIPLAEWLPEPDTVEFEEGDDYPYENVTATVATVESSAVTLEWQAPADVEADLTEGANVTIANGDTYFTHFPDAHSVVLAPQSQYPSYAETVAERDYFAERQAGLWGVTIVSSIAAFLILSMAYLPSRG